ncbi:MAG: ABC transporter transmembrane domain-containing protein [Arhodomonas sp.]|nr:ABC transporter transmembrane domain-containing protein [Arhodomonas sp.]
MWHDLRRICACSATTVAACCSAVCSCWSRTVAGTGLLALSGWFITATAVAAALWAAGGAASLDIYVPGAGIRTFALTRTVARYLERLYNHDTVLRLLAELRTAVFARLSRLDPATLARFRTATLLNRLTADVDALDALYLRILAPPLVALAAVALLGLLMAVFAPLIALSVSLVLLALWFVVNTLAGWGSTAVNRRLADATEALRVGVVEQVDGLAELLAFGTVAGQRRRLLEPTGHGRPAAVASPAVPPWGRP